MVDIRIEALLATLTLEIMIDVDNIARPAAIMTSKHAVRHSQLFNLSMSDAFFDVTAS